MLADLVERDDWKSVIKAKMKTDFLEEPFYTAVPNQQKYQSDSRLDGNSSISQNNIQNSADNSLDQDKYEEIYPKQCWFQQSIHQMDQQNNQDSQSERALVPASLPMDPFANDDIPFASAMKLVFPPIDPY